MCVIRDTAKAVIEQLVKDKETFTVYDITEEVRSRLPSTTVYHYKLRDYLHNLLQVQVDSGLYTKDQDFSKHPNGPFVYTPVGDLTPDPLKPGLSNVIASTAFTTNTVKRTRSYLMSPFKLIKQYGYKPSTSSQPNRKYWNLRDRKGKFTK